MGLKSKRKENAEKGKLNFDLDEGTAPDSNSVGGRVKSVPKMQAITTRATSKGDKYRNEVSSLINSKGYFKSTTTQPSRTEKGQQDAPYQDL